MTSARERNKKIVYRKIKGKVKISFKGKKHKKIHCGLCKRILHGVPHGKKPSEIKKLPKSKRRPSALFAGVLCNKCRENVLEEAVKIKLKVKKEKEISLNEKPFVISILNKIKVN